MEGCIAGLDLGIKHDHSALVVVLVDFHVRRAKVAWVESWTPPHHGQVDLERVYQTLLWARHQYGCSMLAYDPFQAEYMAQRARLAGLESHAVPFTGQHLTSMASAFLEMFRSQQIDIYPDVQLVDDLRRLRIEETSYGYRLSAKRDDRGHADRATALALTLPVVQEDSERTLYAGDDAPEQPRSGLTFAGRRL